MKVPYRCLFNHELLILGTSQSPYCSYEDDVSDAQAVGYVKELKGTGVDALMICPNPWQMVMWPSEVDRRWQDEAPIQKEPGPDSNRRYFDKAYYRLRRYMLSGSDPVALSVNTARESGIAPFISLRMNEAHYARSEECPTMCKLWREHPEYRLEGRRNLNYLEPEVYTYFQGLIFELLDRYDLDGFECDFMRHPCFFPKEAMKEGRVCMTRFVSELRGKLDQVGEERGKRIKLSVRAPKKPSEAFDCGLDVKTWVDKGWIDMIVASSFSFHSTEIDIEGWRALAPETALFGETHFHNKKATTPQGHGNNISRRTNRQLYRTTTLAYLERGADGISLFNFDYVRDHSMSDPRRKYFPGVEPPFDVISSLADERDLGAGSQFVVVTSGFGMLPKPLRDDSQHGFKVYFPGDFEKPFSSGIVRFEANVTIVHIPGFSVFLNGTKLTEIPVQGELFPPLSIEGLPEFHKVRHFSFDPETARHGWNTVAVEVDCPGYNWGHWAGSELDRLEVGLFR